MKNQNETAVVLLSQSFPHKHMFELVRRNEWVCLIGFEITPKNKQISFMTYIPDNSTSEKMLGCAVSAVNQGLRWGRYEVEHKDNYLLCKYTRTLATCFGYWNKKENYTILVNESVKKMQELTSMVSEMIGEG